MVWNNSTEPREQKTSHIMDRMDISLLATNSICKQEVLAFFKQLTNCQAFTRPSMDLGRTLLLLLYLLLYTGALPVLFIFTG